VPPKHDVPLIDYKQDPNDVAYEPYDAEPLLAHVLSDQIESCSQSITERRLFMDEKLIAACQMYLVPMTILFAALGLARTEQLKALISILGFATAGTWLYAVIQWPGLSGYNMTVAGFLAGFFVAAWLVSAIAHCVRWAKGLEEQAPAQRVIIESQPPKHPGMD
jgi:hypothetical protein